MLRCWLTGSLGKSCSIAGTRTNGPTGGDGLQVRLVRTTETCCFPQGLVEEALTSWLQDQLAACSEMEKLSIC